MKPRRKIPAGLFCYYFHSMNKLTLLFCLTLLGCVANAQYSLRIVVTGVPAATKDVAKRAAEGVYVAGNFNNWNPKDENYKMKPLGNNRLSLTLKDVAKGSMMAFKITRGDWSKVECTSDGRDITDRVVEVNTDTTVSFAVEGWKDDYPVKPKPYTASPQVKIIDTAFLIPQLNRTRKVWIYLPKGYATSKVTYPVLYMHDGQNLFNEQTAGFGEWGVDEALDSLQKQTGKEMIIVGIDHGGDKRMTEYNPYDHAKFGKGEGKQYVEFLVNTLKPYIDSKYRTKKDAFNTSVAGSSMGGLISLYAMITYPKTFGAAGIFSPAFWITPQLYDDLQKADWGKERHGFYFYAGGKESATMVSDMNRMADIVEKKHNYKIERVVMPLGMHNEPTWRKEFPAFYRWLVEN